MTTEVLRTADEARAFSDRVRLSRERLALVPTMGFLHRGHLSLIAQAKKLADRVVVSIFVNPIQFGPNEDLGHYPRDWEGDLRKTRESGVSAVFAPEPSQMYPNGFQTHVEVSELQKGLCGERRPGHFRGVATVVTKLFSLLRPHVAIFGEKDYQQLQIIRSLSRDLDLGVEVVGAPIVREEDGLAQSSRNSYLSADERVRARSLSAGLRAGQHRFSQGVLSAESLKAAVREQLSANNAREDYVELVDASTLVPLQTVRPGQPARLLVAAFVGTTRLIDNVAIGS